MFIKENVWQIPALLFPTVLTIQQQDRPQEQVPEPEALSSYLGNWHSKFTVVSDDNISIDEKFTGIVKAHWIVGGRFLEESCNDSLESGSHPMVIKTLMTFDVQDQKYRYRFFDSTGEYRGSTGKWNADINTITSKMRDPDGNETVRLPIFRNLVSNTGIEYWSIETTNLVD